jgi:hypothetical protein
MAISSKSSKSKGKLFSIITILSNLAAGSVVPTSKKPTTKSSKPEQDSANTVVDVAPRRSTRKRAVDFLEEEAEKETTPKKAKRTNTAVEPKPVVAPKETKSKKKKVAEIKEVTEEVIEEDESIVLPDSNALALAFDSDSESDESDGVPDDSIPKLPANIEKQVARAKKQSSDSDIPAVLYIGYRESIHQKKPC